MTFCNLNKTRFSKVRSMFRKYVFFRRIVFLFWLIISFISVYFLHIFYKNNYADFKRRYYLNEINKTENILKENGYISFLDSYFRLYEKILEKRKVDDKYVIYEFASLGARVFYDYKNYPFAAMLSEIALLNSFAEVNPDNLLNLLRIKVFSSSLFGDSFIISGFKNFNLRSNSARLYNELRFLECISLSSFLRRDCFNLVKDLKLEGNRRELIFLYLKLAQKYEEFEKYELAELFYNEAKKMEEFKKSVEIRYAFMLLEKGEIAKAKAIFKEHNNLLGMAYADIKEKKFDSVLELMSNDISYSQKIKDIIMSEYYIAIESYEKAYDILKRLIDEMMMSNFDLNDKKNAFVEFYKKRKLIDNFILVCYKLGKYEEAFRYFDLFNSISFFDALSDYIVFDLFKTKADKSEEVIFSLYKKIFYEFYTLNSIYQYIKGLDKNSKEYKKGLRLFNKRLDIYKKILSEVSKFPDIELIWKYFIGIHPSQHNINFRDKNAVLAFRFINDDVYVFKKIPYSNNISLKKLNLNAKQINERMIDLFKFPQQHKLNLMKNELLLDIDVEGVDKIIIIPDKILWIFPFDIAIERTVSFNNLILTRRAFNTSQSKIVILPSLTTYNSIISFTSDRLGDYLVLASKRYRDRNFKRNYPFELKSKK